MTIFGGIQTLERFHIDDPQPAIVVRNGDELAGRRGLDVTQGSAVDLLQLQQAERVGIKLGEVARTLRASVRDGQNTLRWTLQTPATSPKLHVILAELVADLLGQTLVIGGAISLIAS